LCDECDLNSVTTCLKCSPDLAVLIEGKCLCKKGKYKNVLSGGSYTCSNCPINTYSPYHENNNACTECSDGKYNDEEGLDSCPLLCHKFCSKCSGPNRNECSECKESERLVTLVGNTCECKSGYYFDISSNDCLPCDKFCGECTSLTECTRCNDNQGTTLASGVCKCNNKGYFEYNEECVECHDLCESCTGLSNTECSSCKGGATLTEPQTCSCPPHQYYDPSKRKCERCHASCSSCLGSSNTECIECLSPFYLDGASCIAKCDPGAYPDDLLRRCLTCDSICKDCYGPTIRDCWNCKDDYIKISSGFCLPILCSEGTYLNDFAQCLPCDSSCRTCRGEGIYNCIDCAEGLAMITFNSGIQRLCSSYLEGFEMNSKGEFIGTLIIHQ